MANEQRTFDINDRLLEYSASSIRLVENMATTRAGSHVGGQVLRSGTSPYFNHGEAEAAESPRDFVHKLGVCLKDLRETKRALLTAIAAVALSTSASAAGHFAWVEGESPAQANFEWKATNWPGDERFSGGRWLHMDRKPLDDNGLRLVYEVALPAAGEYQVWLRMGYEWVRPKVSWRLDEGAWTTVGLGDPAELPAAERERAAALEVDFNRRSTNVKGLQPWVEVAWWHVGGVRAEPGKHRLELRFTRTHVPDPPLALDAICLVAGDWTPEGRLRPGETYDAETDRQAAAQVYELPMPPPDAARSELTLTGLWQVARFDDPEMAAAPFEPVARLPEPGEYPLRWTAIPVPQPLSKHPEMGFAHRAIYRTRVRVPEAHRGRGFTLHFSGLNWIASVFVNGRLAGTHRTVLVPWDLDISPYVEPGRDNELAIAIKGPYYAMDTAGMVSWGSLDFLRNRPTTHIRNVQWLAPIYPTSKGGVHGHEWGLVGPVTLDSVGSAYVEDVFVKPSVARKRLDVEVTLRNTQDRERALEVRCQAVHARSGETERSFDPVQVTVPAGGSRTVTVSGAWENPKLWWPKRDPNLYRLRSTVSENGSSVDVHEQEFGFREVAIAGTGITINGIRRNVWNWVTVDGVGKGPDASDRMVANFHAQQNRFARLDETTGWILPTREERLAFYDRAGIPGRLCTAIDGMFISYTLATQKDGKAVLNQPVWDGFREHLVQTVRAYRNHPSIIMYQAENELVFINGQNRYGFAMDLIEEAMADAIEAARTVDPTRPFQVGGAGDLGGRLETLCTHYAPSVDTLDFYPENAYTLTTSAQSSRRWPWKRDKPYISGEDCFLDVEEYSAAVMGDETFRSGEDAERGKSKYLRMLYGGYRWAGVAGFHPWCVLYRYEDARKVFDDLYIVPRKQTARLFSGQTVTLAFRACNDTWSDEPLSVTWTYELEGKTVAEGRERLAVQPGHVGDFSVTLTAPRTDRRLEGILKLRSSQDGHAAYEDERQVPVLPAVDRIKVRGPVALLDRSGRVAPFLTQAGVAFETLDAPTAARDRTGLLIVGPDTLTPGEALGSDLLAFALRGGRVLVLEQDSPLAGGNLPIELFRSEHMGGYAHPQALGTDVFRDLGRDDLIDWAGDHPTFKQVYFKPTQGGRSLAQAGDKLQYSPLIEIPCGQGLMLLCQLRVGTKLAEDPAAAVLLRNLIAHCDRFEPAARAAAVYLPEKPELAERLAATGLRMQRVTELGAALNHDRFAVALVGASPATLQALAAQARQVAAFQAAGGWIMLTELEPAGLDAFNALVGADHLIRRFRMERVTLAQPDHPLMATLGHRDVYLKSSRQIGWGLMWVSWDTYGYVLDGPNIAPFAHVQGAPESLLEYTPTFNDKDPYNLVNGLFTIDNWRYSRQLWNPDPTHPPPATEFTFERPEAIAEVRVWNNAIYSTIAELEVIFDDDAANPVRIEMPDSAAMAAAAIDPPRVARSIKLQPRRMRLKPDSHAESGANLYGFDNVEFLRPADPRRGASLDSVGGLVAFPRRKGGFFLNQLKFAAADPNRANQDSKLNLTSVILQNMGVGARTGAVAVPGLNVRYEPLDITQSCNAYLAHHEGQGGWIHTSFHSSFVDLSRLPRGEQRFAGVPYHVTDFDTAPVPSCVVAYPPAVHARDATKPMAVTGIPIRRKADVLFFLHGAQPEPLHPWNEGPKVYDDPSQAPEVGRYILHYTDGRQAVIPVQFGRHIERFHVKPATELVVRREITHELDGTPILVPDAGVAWSAKAFPEKPDSREHIALYAMMARNPRPDVEIATLDVSQARVTVGNKEDWTRRNNGPFGLVAVTVGRIEE